MQFPSSLDIRGTDQPFSQRSPLLARINFSAASFAQTICRFDLTRTKPKPALAITFPSNSTSVIYSLSRSLSRKARLTRGAIICIRTTPTKTSKPALLSRRRDESVPASLLPPFDRTCRTDAVVDVLPGQWDAARIMVIRTTPDENALVPCYRGVSRVQACGPTPQPIACRSPTSLGRP